MFVRAFGTTAIVLAFWACALPAHARNLAQIQNYENVSVTTGSGKLIPAEKMREVFVAAGARRSWAFKDAGPGKLIGTLIVRGRHTVEVEVTYSPERYSVVYKNSSNMNYSEQGSLIHPNYNKWVADLMNAVRSELSKF
jgi:hypothetical protein